MRRHSHLIAAAFALAAASAIPTTMTAAPPRRKAEAEPEAKAPPTHRHGKPIAQWKQERRSRA